MDGIACVYAEQGGCEGPVMALLAHYRFNDVETVMGLGRRTHKDEDWWHVLIDYNWRWPTRKLFQMVHVCIVHVHKYALYNNDFEHVKLPESL